MCCDCASIPAILGVECLRGVGKGNIVDKTGSRPGGRVFGRADPAGRKGAGAGGGGRTHTRFKPQRILSPSRLPIPPRRHSAVPAATSAGSNPQFDAPSWRLCFVLHAGTRPANGNSCVCMRARCAGEARSRVRRRSVAAVGAGPFASCEYDEGGEARQVIIVSQGCGRMWERQRGAAARKSFASLWAWFRAASRWSMVLFSPVCAPLASPCILRTSAS